MPPFCLCSFDRTVPGPEGDAGAEPVAALGQKVSELVKQYLAGERLPDHASKGRLDTA